MKIGQFTDSFLPIVDGVGRVAYQYCDLMARKEGVEVTAIVPLQKIGYRAQYPFEIIDYYSKSLPKVPYSAGIPFLDEHFMAHLAMTSFDIVHVHSPFISGFQGIQYAKKHDIPLVGTFHSKYYDDFYQITNSKGLAKLGTDVVLEYFNQCDEVWAATQASADTLRSYGFKKNIEIMPFGIFKPSVSADQAEMAKKHFGLDERPMLLYVGQMNWKKNIGRILEACELLKKSGGVFQLALCGQGPHEKEILAKVKAANLEENTVYCGHVQDVSLLDGLYAAADLFVFPSLYDTFGLVVREAANCGTPSVCVRDSNAADGIIDAENGFLCEDDSRNLCFILNEAISDRKKTAKIGQMASETLAQSWDEIIDRVLERYQYLIDNYTKRKDR